MDADTTPRNPLVIAALVCGVLVVVGAFLPWATLAGIVSKRGTEGDGSITIILAVIGVIAALLASRRRGMLVMQLIAAALIALIGVIDVADISGDSTAGAFGISVGSGLWMTLIAGIAWSLVAIAMVVRARGVRSPAEPAQ